MSVHNPPEVSSRVSDRLRPVWSWGTNGAGSEAQTASPEGGAGGRAAPTPEPEPESVELVGRAVDRPSWAWGGGPRDAGTAPAAPDLAAPAAQPAEPPPPTLPAGPPAWCWDAAVVMEVILEPPQPWTWAAVAAGMEAAAPAPPPSPVAPLPRSTAPTAASSARWSWGPSAGSTAAPAAPSAPAWSSTSVAPAAPSAPAWRSASAAPAAPSAPAWRSTPAAVAPAAPAPAVAAATPVPLAQLLVVGVLVAGWALTFSTARAVVVLPAVALYLLVAAARSATARIDHAVEAVLLAAGFVLAIGGRLVAAWTLGWVVVFLTLLELAGLSLGSVLIRG
ncbi:MAG: hypothetical protein QOE72_1332 [Chloroflexota bacterium]|nr:hypothetical protein [Chloroflexota bacterium]